MFMMQGSLIDPKGSLFAYLNLIIYLLIYLTDFHLTGPAN